MPSFLSGIVDPMYIIAALIIAISLLVFHCLALEVTGIIYSFFIRTWATVLVSENSNHGDIIVTQTRIGQRILLINDGVIHSIHGGRDGAPEGYCHSGSGVADVLLHRRIVPDAARVTLIGLGGGAMLFYARKGQQWLCYEINPSVIKFATNRDVFTFVTSCPARPMIFCADGFSAINQLGEQDVIVVDTFFGDHNVGSPEILEGLINGSGTNTIFVLHVSGLSDKDISTIAKFGGSRGFTSIIKETPIRDKRLGRCALNDFRHPFYMPSKWMVMSRDYRNIADLFLHPGWEALA